MTIEQEAPAPVKKPRKGTQCRATSRRTGQRCGKFIQPGSLVCKNHGGDTPVIKRKAEVRRALHESLNDDDRRPMWEVLLDAAHSMDVLMRDAKMKVTQDGENIDPEKLTRFIEATERAARLAKVSLDARVNEMMAMHISAEGGVIADVLMATLDAAELTPEQWDKARPTMREALRRFEERKEDIRTGREVLQLESTNVPTTQTKKPAPTWWE